MVAHEICQDELGVRYFLVGPQKAKLSFTAGQGNGSERFSFCIASIGAETVALIVLEDVECGHDPRPVMGASNLQPGWAIVKEMEA